MRFVMKLKKTIKVALFSAVCLIANATALSVAHAKEYSFRVHNSTDSRITKILVSENKRDWGFFDIGKGIKSGDNANLIWSKSTNNEACDQWVKAVFADGSEAKPSKFDFCENDLEIEF